MIANRYVSAILRHLPRVLTDFRALSGGLVRSVHVEDTVGVDVEGHLDLGDTPWRGRDTRKLELAEEVAVLCLGTLALEHLDEHTGLVVAVGGEDLALLGRDGGVALDKRGHDATSGLDTHGEGGNVEEQEILRGFRGITGKDGSLDGSTVGNGFIWVDLLPSAFGFIRQKQYAPSGWARDPRTCQKRASGSWGYGWIHRRERSR